jgi:hypothetical protein
MPPAPHSPAAEAQDHASLIVALDAGDLAGDDLVAAEALASSCTGCAALVRDLAAIRGAMAALPVPPRRRDYRLTDADAARLRPGGWRRLVDWLAAPGSTVRPLATGLATLGVVGLLLTAGLPGVTGGFGSGASGPLLSTVGGPLENQAPSGAGGAGDPYTYAPAAAPTAAPAAAPSAGPAGLTEAASPEPSAARRSTTGTEDAARDDGETATKLAATGPGVPVGVVLSAVLLAAGLALLLARAIALRRA